MLEDQLLVQVESNRPFVKKVVINICLSTFYAGYSVCYFNTIDFDVTFWLSFFGFSFSIFLSCVFCCLWGLHEWVSAKQVLSTPRNSLHQLHRYSLSQIRQGVCQEGCGVLCLLQVQNLYTLVIARIIQGWTVGVFASIVPNYIKEISPPDLAGEMGPYNQIAFTSALTLAFFFSWVFSCFTTPLFYWRIIYAMPIIALLLQSYHLNHTFVFDTPKYLMMKRQQNKAELLLNQLYILKQGKQAQFIAFIGQRMKQIREGIQKTQPKINEQMRQLLIRDVSMRCLEGNNKYQWQQKSKSLACLTAVHLMIMQQMSGNQSLINYGGEIFKEVVPQLCAVLPILLHGQATVVAVMTSKVLRYVGRRWLMLLGGAMCGCLNLAMVVLFGYKQELWAKWMLVGVIFGARGMFGFTLGPVINLYVPEIVETDWVAIAVALNQLTAGLVAFTFPILHQLYSPAFVFLLYALYCCIATLFNYFLLVETKGKPQTAIQAEFQHKYSRCKLFFCS